MLCVTRSDHYFACEPVSMYEPEHDLHPNSAFSVELVTRSDCVRPGDT